MIDSSPLKRKSPSLRRVVADERGTLTTSWCEVGHRPIFEHAILGRGLSEEQQAVSLKPIANRRQINKQ
eukprot:755644-Hanusia_phi.AAC.2